MHSSLALYSLRQTEGDEFSLDMSGSLELTSLFSPALNQTIVDLDKLTVEETRDLLISLLFVLKNLEKGDLNIQSSRACTHTHTHLISLTSNYIIFCVVGLLLHWWEDAVATNWCGKGVDNLPSQFTTLLDFFDMLE